MSGQPILAAQGLHLGYGSRVVVEDCSIEVSPGEVVALIGANGAGKSTTLKSLVGIQHVKSGVVRFNGAEVTGWSPGAAVAAGMVLCPEGRHLFPEMSVRDNIVLGAARSRLSKAEVRARIAEIEELFPKLAERRHQLAGTLSGGEQQMVALGRALASKPRLLILDEPTLGLAPLMVEKVFELVRTVAETGTSILIAEQNVTATLEAADRVYLMEAGRITHQDSSVSMRTDPRLTAALMGI